MKIALHPSHSPISEPRVFAQDMSAADLLVLCPVMLFVEVVYEPLKSSEECNLCHGALRKHQAAARCKELATDPVIPNSFLDEAQRLSSPGSILRVAGH